MRRIALALTAAAALAGCGSGGERAATEPLVQPELAELGDAGTPAAVDDGPLAARVAALQRVGLFAGERPEAVARTVARRHRRTWGERLVVRTVVDELTLAAYDRDRVWAQDTELDVLPGNDVWVETLRAWARISRGAFRPRDVRETWRGEGDVTIRFRLGGKAHAVTAEGLDGWLDLCVIEDLNRAIPGDRKLAVHEAHDQTAFVIALTPRERRALERRRWRFAEGDELRRPFTLGQTAERGAGRCG